MKHNQIDLHFLYSLTFVSRPDLNNIERKTSIYFNNVKAASLATPALFSLSWEYRWKEGLCSHRFQNIICSSVILR